jgi:hypothetical protein
MQSRGKPEPLRESTSFGECCCALPYPGQDIWTDTNHRGGGRADVELAGRGARHGLADCDEALLLHATHLIVKHSTTNVNVYYI